MERNINVNVGYGMINEQDAAKKRAYLNTVIIGLEPENFQPIAHGRCDTDKHDIR
jgi:hypothetical protein